MSCLRSYVKIKKKQEETDNVGLIFALAIVACLFFAGHTMVAKMGQLHGALKKRIGALFERQAVQNGKNILANDATHTTLENIGNAIDVNDDRERD